MLIATPETAKRVLALRAMGPVTLLTRQQPPKRLNIRGFNEDEARDDHGRWTVGPSGVGHFQPAEKKVAPLAKATHKRLTAAAVMKQMGWKKVGAVLDAPHWKRAGDEKHTATTYYHPKYGTIIVNHSGGFKHTDLHGEVQGRGSGRNKEYQRLGKEASGLREYLNRLQGQQQVQPIGKEAAVVRPQSQTAPDENALATLPITSSESLHVGGIHDNKEKLQLADGTYAMWKPNAGGADQWVRRGQITPGKDAEREVGAWKVAKLVGMQDLVQQSVIRDLPDHGGRGALIRWADGQVARNATDQWDGKKDLARVAAFDYVIGNTDRHGGNWIVDNMGKLHMIDHGLAFTEQMKARGNTMIFDRMRWGMGYDKPKDLAAPYVENKEKIQNALKSLDLPGSAVKYVGARIDKLAQADNWRDL